MRNKFCLIFALILIVLIQGCSTSVNRLDFKEPTTTVNPNIGYLIVHTLPHQEKTWPDEPHWKVYSSYDIYTTDGQHLLTTGQAYSKPDKIKLPLGKYVVVAKMAENEIHSIKVVIEPGKITEVFPGQPDAGRLSLMR